MKDIICSLILGMGVACGCSSIIFGIVGEPRTGAVFAFSAMICYVIVLAEDAWPRNK